MFTTYEQDLAVIESSLARNYMLYYLNLGFGGGWELYNEMTQSLVQSI